MKKIIIAAIIFSIAISCSKHDTTPEIEVNYPAAFVINGESSTISVINLSSDETKTINLNTNNKLSALHSSKSDDIFFPHHIYLSPDGNKLSIGVPGVDLSEGHTGEHQTQGKILIIDAKNGNIINTKILEKPNHNATFSPDGKEIWTTSMEHHGKTLVFDAQNLSLKNTIEVGEEPAEVTFSIDGKYAFTANGGSNSVSVIDPVSKKVIKTIPVGVEPVGAWPAEDGNMYVDNEVGQTISIINASKLEVTETIELGFTPGYVAYNQLQNELWISNAGKSFVYYYTKINGKWSKKGSIQTGLDAHAIAFSKDGKTAFVTNQKNLTVSIIDVLNHQKIKDIPVGQKPNGIVIKN
ncbi:MULTISPECIES: YncE family protein [Emticicia]|uniref:YncE family protein n=1 Tax=Emticicia TaxID=312278 RepID=UPI0007D8A299|nr:MULTISPECIES: YncE family protein [Emticicia]